MKLGDHRGRFGWGITWDGAWRVGVVAGLLLIHRLTFPSLYPYVDSAAFVVGMLPCVVAGSLLGIVGGLLTVVAAAALDGYLATSVGLAAQTGIAAFILSIAANLSLAMGAALVARSSRRLKAANAQMALEVRRREQSENLMAARERRNTEVLECLGEGVGLFDEADCCVFANPAWHRTFGKDESSILGMTFAAHLDAASQARVAQLCAESTAAQRSYEVVLDGATPKVLLVTETRVTGDDPGRGNRTLRVVRDDTQRIESEKKQRDFEQQMQRGQALQSLAVLAGGVAHDFNNLLSGVVGNAEFALRRVPPSAPPELGQCIEEICGFATEATQLSRQMLAYAGRRSLAASPIDINAEIREALRLLHSTIESQAMLELDFEQGLSAVKGDRLQLRQVVTNLVLNALDAMASHRGNLTIRTRAMQLQNDDLLCLRVPQEARAGKYVEIVVEDSGVGIPPEIRERIFEPFFSTKAPGRGMGLAATIGIVRSHHGVVDVRSEVGRGSTFRVMLPLTSESDTTALQAPVRRGKPTRAGCILLIDDEPAVRIVTRRLLQDLGQRVLTAADGHRGLEQFRQHHATIDLVLLDLTMPELSGAEVLAGLREISSDVHVVVTSGFHPSDASALLKLPNVVGFLEKPHTIANLESIVSSFCVGSKSHRYAAGAADWV